MATRLIGTGADQFYKLKFANLFDTSNDASKSCINCASVTAKNVLQYCSQVAHRQSSPVKISTASRTQELLRAPSKFFQPLCGLRQVQQQQQQQQHRWLQCRRRNRLKADRLPVVWKLSNVYPQALTGAALRRAPVSCATAHPDPAAQARVRVRSEEDWS